MLYRGSNSIRIDINLWVRTKDVKGIKLISDFPNQETFCFIKKTIFSFARIYFVVYGVAG